VGRVEKNGCCGENHHQLRGKSDLDSRIDAEATRATSLATMVAESPSARVALETADRQALLTEFRPVYDSLRQLGAIDQFQFHVPFRFLTASRTPG
jgi:hypothetical protein